MGLQTSTQPYKYNGKEFDGEHGLNLYDYVARLMDPTLGGRFQTIDPLAEKYYSISPYAYCANNPVKFIDPDGNRLVAMNNSQGVMYNIAKTVVLSNGQKVIDRLITSKSTYSLTGTFWTSSSSYNKKTNEINYVKNPWLKSVDGGVITSSIAMGHELMHAYQDDIGMFRYADREQLESGAVNFENYLRSSWGEKPLRSRYSGLNVRLSESKEQPKSILSDFQNIFQSDDSKSAGFKATITTGNVQQTRYVVVYQDERGNITYKFYDNEKEFRNQAQ